MVGVNKIKLKYESECASAVDGARTLPELPNLNSWNFAK
jgi:hypothetical protein